jgi:hypothetical protein
VRPPRPERAILLGHLATSRSSDNDVKSINDF